MSEEHKQYLADYVAKKYQHLEILGLGGGSTVLAFLRALAQLQTERKAALTIASRSIAQEAVKLGFPVVSWRSCQQVEHYFDGADFIDSYGYMIKGGGGAALGEKIVSSLAREFICLYETRKEVKNILQQPLYCEVLPKASSYVAHCLREHGITLQFIDKYSELEYWIMQAEISKTFTFEQLDSLLNSIPGLISHGLFTKPADRGYQINSQTQQIKEVKFTLL